MRHTSRVTVAVAVVGTVALLAGCGSSKSDASRKPGKPSDSPAATAATPTPGGSGAGASSVKGDAATTPRDGVSACSGSLEDREHG